MFGFSTDAMMAILRQLLTLIGGIIVAKGWINGELMGEVSGFLVAVISTFFSIFFHAQSNGSISTLSTTSNAGTVPNATTGSVTSHVA